MANEELKKYVEQNLNAGHQPDTIKTALVQHGYKPEDIDEAIKAVTSGNKEGPAESEKPEESKESEGGKKKMEIDMSSPHYGGFWIRFLAAILDMFIIGIPAGILQGAIVFLTGMASLSSIVSVAVIVFVIYMDGIKGGTPGKLVLGLRIVNESGTYIGIPMAILRYIGKILSGIILCIGFLMIAFTQKKQGLHDFIAKTFVVYKR